MQPRINGNCPTETFGLAETSSWLEHWLEHWLRGQTSYSALNVELEP